MSPNQQAGMPALHGRTICTAPFLNFRTFAQTRVHGIHCRVMATTMQVVVIADKVVKRFHLPKGCSGAPKQTVGFAGSEAFPDFQHLAQCPVRLWTKHGMHMVRHHHPRMKIKALTGVEFHCSRNQVGDFGTCQPAIAVTHVEIFNHTRRIPAKQFFLLVPRQRAFGGQCLCRDDFALAFEAQQNVFGQRPRQAKSHKVRSASAFEMGQNTPGMKTRCKGTRIRFHTARIHERENVVSTCRKQARAGAVAQTFLSAGSRDIPVPCEPGDKNVAQPAGRNACSTF